MREILFRGKRHGKGEWVYGLPFYSYTVDGVAIEGIEEFGGSESLYAVHPESIGQYTNRRDKNGNRIFEGDIIRIPGSNKKGLPAQVWYNPYDAFFEIRRMGYNPLVLDASEEWAEVIGNIHDNPELLEVEA